MYVKSKINLRRINHGSDYRFWFYRSNCHCGDYVIFAFVPIGLWISALASNVHVGIFTLVGMRMRRVPPQKLYCH